MDDDDDADAIAVGDAVTVAAAVGAGVVGTDGDMKANELSRFGKCDTESKKWEQ
jgi:hypothetical protein